LGADAATGCRDCCTAALLNVTAACQHPLQPVAASATNHNAHNKPSRLTVNKTHAENKYFANFWRRMFHWCVDAAKNVYRFCTVAKNNMAAGHDSAAHVPTRLNECAEQCT